VNPLRARAAEYLAMRRSLGYTLHADERLLAGFIGYLEREDQVTITTTAALAWATQPAGVAPSWHRRRLSVVRCFARHLAAYDPACEVPPARLLLARESRITPYLYSPAEIAALIHAAGLLGRPPLAATYQALISLLAVSGLRIGEALALNRRDVDLDAGTLTVTGKSGKIRLVPLHPSTTGMLRDYAARRDSLCPAACCPNFFINTMSNRIRVKDVDVTFVRVLALAGVHAPPGRRRPRVHDIRHTFVLNTFLRWYRDGTDVPASLPVLSTFLGHASPASTWWYQQAAPELLAVAAQRLQPLKEES
jgi:integrase/recombinase XerD